MSVTERAGNIEIRAMLADAGATPWRLGDAVNPVWDAELTSC